MAEVGRPSTYDPEYCEQVIALGREGKSLCQISAALDIPRSTMHSWGKQHEEFSAALSRAKELEQAWWEDKATDGTVGSQGRINPVVWRHSMNNRFRTDYGDRVSSEVSGPNGGPIQTEDTTKRDADAFTSRMAGLAAAGRAGAGDGEPDAGGEGGA